MDESQSAKRKSDETVAMDAQTKKRQTAETAVSFPTVVQIGGSSTSGSSSADPEQTEPRVVVPPEVPQDARSSIVDMELGQLKPTSRVKKVQGVSLDADRRELQKLAIDNAEYYFRDKQVEASDSLIDEVGALLTESGGAQIIEMSSPGHLTTKAGE